MFIASIIGLGLLAIVGVLALFSGHIPWLAWLTGAAPLQPEETDHARDFAATDAAGYITRADWGPDPVRLQLPAADADPEVRP